MSFYAICNDPYERNRITQPFITWDRGFNEEELNAIGELGDKAELQEAWTMGDEEENKLKDVRKSYVKFFNKTEETDWIFNRFNTISALINDQFYGFNLNGYSSFQYTVYKGEEKGKYDWHMDTILGNNLKDMSYGQTRKLSLIMLISEPEKDFTGGEFELNLGKESNAARMDLFRGRILAFPSFLIHRVNPVLSGVRKSIVIWVEGPKFI